MKPKSDFLHVLQERGFLHQCSDWQAVDQLANRRELIAYVGYDCTAPSLHIGSLVSIMMLYWLQETGNRPIVLLGGGTTQIGDPSGKEETRKPLSKETIWQNQLGIQKVFQKFISFTEEKENRAFCVDNAQWLEPLRYLPLLAEIGRHFSVNRMLTFDSVKLRLEREQELSFTEFNYMILQALDFVELAKKFGCNLQMGGSDQWGNMVSGIDLARRMQVKHPLQALTTPLLLTASGTKMGKTVAGAIWLDEEAYSPYQYWQYWRNVPDEEIGRFLRLFTLLPLAEIQRLEQLGGAEKNEAKKILATEVTALLHGKEKAEKAKEAAQKTFEEGKFSSDLPTFWIEKRALSTGLSVLNAFVQAGLCSSNSEAKRRILDRGLRVNDRLLEDPMQKLTLSDYQEPQGIKLSFGKKLHALLQIRKDQEE